MLISYFLKAPMKRTLSESLIATNLHQLTPMMQQYMQIKAEHKDYLLFYRMGDFYELFFDDAVTASQVLDIILTKRGKHQDQEIPMCGVPASSYEQYLDKLIKAGYKVAVCEQLETPEEAKKRGAKSVVKREVIRIITSGTLIEEHLLNSKQSNFLASISLHEGQLAIAWAEVTTGSFYISASAIANLQADLSRLSPSEILISDRLYEEQKVRDALNEHRQILSIRSHSVFNLDRANTRLLEFFKVNSLEGLGVFSSSEMIAAGSLIEYLEHTYKANLPRLEKPKKLTKNSFMSIDPSTRNNLELETSLSGDKKSCLLYVINKTLTAGGGRLLHLYINTPLVNVEAINRRLDNLEFFTKHPTIKEQLREMLRHFPDIERALSRVYLKRCGPRDLNLIRNGLEVAAKICEFLLNSNNELTHGLRICLSQIGNFNRLLSLLKSALKQEVPLQLKDGGFIKEGYDTRLDSLYDLKNNSKNKIENLKEKYKQLTSIANLKISYNNILGYFIDITPSNTTKMQNEIFRHRQTLGNSVRYTTVELQELEADLLSCDNKISELEQQLFKELCEQVINIAEHIGITSQAISQLDVFSSLAQLAVDNGYSRPRIDNSLKFEIEGGRHPVVEKLTKEEFIANNCNLNSDNYIYLLTGPNMAGKSTFLRQNALICIMAQIGSFVPARKVHIGVVDKLFSRIGAGDNIAKGQSTFMVEMIETSYILNNATNKSLVILDEIGRGTSTYDGLSIAWAVIENIHNQLFCRTLFATHYHELTDLEKALKGLTCYTMNIKEWEGKVIFLHQVIKGASNRAYGIHVAELAGLPKNVTERANEILNTLQSKEATQLNIQQAAANQNNELQQIANEIKAIDIDNLTPKDAFSIIYNLKTKVRS